MFNIILKWYEDFIKLPVSLQFILIILSLFFIVATKDLWYNNIGKIIIGLMSGKKLSEITLEISRNASSRLLYNRIIVYEFPRYSTVLDKNIFVEELKRVVDECRKLGNGLTLVFCDIRETNNNFIEAITICINDIIEKNNILCKLIFSEYSNPQVKTIYHNTIKKIKEVNCKSVTAVMKLNEDGTSSQYIIFDPKEQTYHVV